jgi:hypothetical protein
METTDKERNKSIGEGIRRGLARCTREPLPRQIEELARLLQRQSQASGRQANNQG